MKNVASEGRSCSVGAQQAQRLWKYVRIASTAGTRDPERSRFSTAAQPGARSGFVAHSVKLIILTVMPSLRAALILLLVWSSLGVAAAEDYRALGATLGEFVTISLPHSPAPYPVAILLPGCLSWHPHHDQWRDALLNRGYAVIHIDSFAAAGLHGRVRLQREVCSGKTLRGDRRAGDVMAALAALTARDDLDLGQTVLLAWSHGGWSAFEFLQRLESGMAPDNLTEVPPLTGFAVRAAALFYPYCGPGVLRSTAYPSATPTLVLHGELDRITAPAACRTKVEALRRHGADIEFLSLPNVGHWFDNHAEPGAYDEQTTLLARERINALLDAARAHEDTSHE